MSNHIIRNKYPVHCPSCHQGKFEIVLRDEGGAVCIDCHVGMPRPAPVAQKEWRNLSLELRMLAGTGKG